MIDDEQLSPQPSGTWEPDDDELIALAEAFYRNYSFDDHRTIMRAVIAVYRDQQRANGVVEVPLEFLVTMRNITQNYPPDGSIEMVTEVLTNLIDRHEGILAAAQEQP